MEEKSYRQKEWPVERPQDKKGADVLEMVRVSET
jgi:hypothetical protein